MFSLQYIVSGQKYCICQDSWRHFKIVDIASISSNTKIKIGMHTFGGLKKNLIEIDRTQPLPNFLKTTNFEFSPKEHIAIDVNGCNITLLGISHSGARIKNVKNRFLLSCPFANFDNVVVGFGNK